MSCLSDGAFLRNFNDLGGLFLAAGGAYSTAARAAGGEGGRGAASLRGAVEAPQPEVPQPAPSTESSESESETRRL